MTTDQSTGTPSPASAEAPGFTGPAGVESLRRPDGATVPEVRAGSLESVPSGVAASAAGVAVRGSPASGNQASAPGAEYPEGHLSTRPERFINRELSWLEFGARLLELSADGRIPLFGRVRFLAIFSESLDEFFQVRVAGLEDQIAAGLRTRSPDGMSPVDQLRAITERVAQLVRLQSRIFSEQVEPALGEAGVVVADWHTLDDDDRDHLVEVFNRQIFPILTPLAVDQGHPFPYISNLSLNLVVRVVDPGSGEQRIARVKVPPLLPRFVVLPDGQRIIAVEQVIAAQLDSLFPAMTIAEHHVFRVTRNADLSVEEDEARDLLAAVELELHRRRFGHAVRLEVSSGVSTDLLDMLIAEVDVREDNVYLFDVPVDLGGLRALMGLDRPELSPEPWTPLTPPQLAGDADIFSVVAEADVLVHHPYDSFATSVQAFVALAAEDPDVLAIKQTLYRTSENSPIVDSLIRASHSGKQVTAVVELQARFDEQANIAWARALEEAGVQVVYGLVRLKTHSKISLVVRREADEIRRYCHIGSGNYNSHTAGTYEDVGLLTADPGIGADVGELFNLLAGSGDPPEFRRLVVSPLSTRSTLVESIEEEARAGAGGRIVLKTNGLTDPEIIDSLYRASQAGASVDLIVRGKCCLRPGLPGLSENIRVRSIVGRYLEHSRIFAFGGVGGRPIRVSFGSPDLMERNLDRRVEVVVPIAEPGIQRRLVGILEDALRDEANAWTLSADGSWHRVAPDRGPGSLGFNLQDHFQTQALESLRRRRDAAQAAHLGPRPVPLAVPEWAAGQRPRWWGRRNRKRG
ncbi:MAG TPA: polyphosphate kinase 1 [Acidimicrobiales bacterium]|nr:polyphosphate kinase 1 [Acidimicrobiales bacterium]